MAGCACAAICAHPPSGQPPRGRGRTPWQGGKADAGPRGAAREACTGACIISHQALNLRKQNGLGPGKFPGLRRCTDAHLQRSRVLLAHAQALPQKARAKYKSSLQGTLVVAGNSMPVHPRVPPYKAWSYLKQNELAKDVGNRVFYTDATGAA